MVGACFPVGRLFSLSSTATSKELHPFDNKLTDLTDEEISHPAIEGILIGQCIYSMNKLFQFDTVPAA